MPSNPGIPVTGAAENIAAEVIRAYWLVDPVWIEYHPEDTTAAGIESFELVVFSDHKIREAVRSTGPGSRSASRRGRPWTVQAWSSS